MKTASIYVQTLCVPCENRCRYCLLSWDGRVLGADYDRSERYARQFQAWLKENRPEISFQFYFGYSMEHPRLLETIGSLQSMGCVGGEFLQFDGMKFRSEAETAELLGNLKDRGIRLIDLTFYGTREYHDRFAARQGDFDYMVDILREANTIGLDVRVSIPVTTENAGQLEELLDVFAGYKVQQLSCFVPHGEGRGRSLDGIRLTIPEFDALSPRAKAHFNRTRFRPEKEWLAQKNFSVPEERMLAISLTPENIRFFETMEFEETIAWLEKLDDEYYRAVPSLPELAEQYGNPDGEEFYSERDLYLHYQRMYIQENHLELYDVNDERQCFSRRF